MSSSRNSFRLMLCLLCLLLTSFDLQAFAETQGNAIAAETRANTSYTVRFYTEAGGTPLSTQTIEEGQTITVLPEAPFKAGSHFVGWNTRADGTGDPVAIGYTVTADMDVYAIFSTIKVYKATMEYWYEKANGTPYIFETQLIEFEGAAGGHVIDCPPNVMQDQSLTGDQKHPMYYPEQPTITLTQSDFDAATYNETEGVYELLVKQVKYVPSTATYSIAYMLKDLSGSGYTEIEREDNIPGVRGSTVTAPIKEYSYATFESTSPTVIDAVSGTVIPVYYTRNTMTLTYDVQGGNHIAQQTGLYGSTVTITSAVPTRDGYTFIGWYDDPTNGNPVTGSITLNENKTIYAHWKAGNVHYTIVYMFEKYNDAGTETSYVYDNSEDGTATVGDIVYASASTIPDKTRIGYEKNTTMNNSSSVVVAADGSSVLYVYYKLKEYTFRFNAGRCQLILIHDVTATLVNKNCNGTGLLSCYTMTVKLGQNISNTWPYDVTGTYNTCIGTRPVYFQGWQHSNSTTFPPTKRITVTADMLPSSGNSITYTAQWNDLGATNYTVNFYLQNANNNDYTPSDLYSQTYRSNNSNFEEPEIPGYTFYRRENIGNTFNLYYNRNTNSIEYYHNNELRRTISNVKFEANINSNTYDWTPTPADMEAWGVDNDYTWDGWYAESGLTIPYVFNTMPSSNVALYGKFIAPQYTVTFNVNGGTGSIPDQTVDKHSRIAYPALPTRDNYSFTGWFTEPECTIRYDFTSPVTEGFTLYAGWRANPLEYTVHYVDANNPNTKLFPDKIVNSAFLSEGQTITETAVNVVGKIPDAGSKSITLSYSGTNSITFVYTTRNETTGYTVQYVLADNHNVKIHADKVVTGISGNTITVTETAVAQDNSWMASQGYSEEDINKDYYPLNEVMDLTLSSNIGQNVLIFEYTNYKTATLTVNFFDMDGNTLEGKTPETHHPRIGDTYYANSETLTGWSFDHALVNGSLASQYMTTDNSDVTIDIFYKKQLTILAKDLEKVYDGTPLQSNDIDDILNTDGLQNGHTLDNISFSGSQTDVGESATTPHNAVITGPTSGTDYYKIEYVKGNLTVTPAIVNITIDPDRWTGNYYKGSSYKAGFTNSNKTKENYIGISNVTYKTQYLDIIWSTLMTKFPDGVVIERTNVGNYTVAGANIFQQSDLPNSGNNYTITLLVREAQLEIKPVQLTVTTGSGEKTYDGTALTNSEASITGFVNGETATVTATGSLIPAGNIPNSYTIDWGSTLSSNYTINEELGTLTVTPATLTVTVKDRTLNYNGAAQEGYTITTVTGTGSEISNDNYTVTGLAAGDVLTVTYTPASGTDAGTYTNGAFATEYTIVNAETIDVSANYGTPTRTAGSLTINKIDVAVAIVGENSAVDYDGTEHSVSGYTASTENTLYNVTGDNIDFTFSGTDEAARTNAGTTNMGLAASQFANTNDNFNVTFNVTDGYQTINPITATVTIIGHNQTNTYDATEHSISGYETTFNTSLYTAADFTFNGNAVAKRTDFGQTDMGLASSQFTNTNTNFSEVTFNVTDGYQKIDRAEVTVTADNKTKLYGATEPALTVTITGLQGSDPESLITYSISRVAGEELGNYDINVTGAENQGNYHVTFAKGTFTINGMPQPITIASASESVTYDGQLHKKEVYTVTFDGVTLTPDATGKVFTMPITGDKLTITPTFTGVTNVADANNIDNNNTFTYILENDETYIGTRTITTGTVKVEPASATVTIVGHTAGFDCDGNAHTVHGYNVTIVDAANIYAKGDFTFNPAADSIVTASTVGTYPMNLQGKFTNNNTNYNPVTFNVTDGSLVIVDTIKPILTGTWPANITGQNNPFARADISGLLSDDAAAALYSDNCGGTVTASHTDANTLTDDCYWKITRTYTITDACGNTVTPAPTMSVSGFDKSVLPQAETGVSVTGQTGSAAEGLSFVNEQGGKVSMPRVTPTGRLIKATPPTVSTAAISGITATTALCGGNITADGDAALTARGVCWSTQPNPTLTDNAGFTMDGYCSGTFSSELTGLTSGTTYYVRAYATNGMGTSYGEVISFTTK